MMTFEIWDLQYFMLWKLYFVVFKADTTERVWKVFFFFFMIHFFLLTNSSSFMFSSHILTWVRWPKSFFRGSLRSELSCENQGLRLANTHSHTHIHTLLDLEQAERNSYIKADMESLKQTFLRNREGGRKKKRERQRKAQTVEIIVMVCDWLNRWCNGHAAALWGQQRASIMIPWH